MYIVEETQDYKLEHHVGVTRYTGCQCMKDCFCKEDFKPERYDYYIVKKKFNKPHSTLCSTLEKAQKHIELLVSLPNKRYDWHERKWGKK